MCLNDLFPISSKTSINASIQKGCMEKVPGCWERMSMVWDWNAYGSVPHRLIYFALKSYGVSEKWIKIIQQYYGGIWNLRERKTTRVKSRMNSTFL